MHTVICSTAHPGSVGRTDGDETVALELGQLLRTQ
jgi:hypothetical protein